MQHDRGQWTPAKLVILAALIATAFIVTGTIILGVAPT